MSNSDSQISHRLSQNRVTSVLHLSIGLLNSPEDECSLPVSISNPDIHLQFAQANVRTLQKRNRNIHKVTPFAATCLTKAERLAFILSSNCCVRLLSRTKSSLRPLLTLEQYQALPRFPSHSVYTPVSMPREDACLQ